MQRTEQELEQLFRSMGITDQGQLDLAVQEALDRRAMGSPIAQGSMREPNWLIALARDPSQYERAPEPAPTGRAAQPGQRHEGVRWGSDSPGRNPAQPVIDALGFGSERPETRDYSDIARTPFEADILNTMNLPRHLGQLAFDVRTQAGDYFGGGGGASEEEAPQGLDLSRLVGLQGAGPSPDVSAEAAAGAPSAVGGFPVGPGIPTPDFGEMRAMLERERARAAGEPADFTDLAAMLDGLNPEELSEGRIQEIRRNAILGAISQAAGNIDSTTPVGSMLLQLGLAGAGGGAMADEREETLRRSRRDEMRQVAGMRLNMRQMQEDARQRQMDRDQRWGETIINSEMQMQSMAQDAAIAQSNLAIAREELGIRRAQLVQDDVISLGGGQFAIVRRGPDGSVTVERGDGSTGRQFYSLTGQAAVVALSEIAAQEESNPLAIGLPLAQSILGNNLLPIFAEALDVEQNDLYRTATQAVGGQHITDMGGDPTAMIQSAMAVELMRAYSEASPEVQQQILDQWIDLMTEGSYVPQLP